MKIQNENTTYFKGDFGKHQRIKREKFLPFEGRQFRPT